MASQDQLVPNNKIHIQIHSPFYNMFLKIRINSWRKKICYVCVCEAVDTYSEDNKISEAVVPVRSGLYF